MNKFISLISGVGVGLKSIKFLKFESRFRRNVIGVLTDDAITSCLSFYGRIVLCGDIWIY